MTSATDAAVRSAVPSRVLALVLAAITVLLPVVCAAQSTTVPIEAAKLAAAENLPTFYAGRWNYYSSVVLFDLDGNPAAYAIIFSNDGQTPPGLATLEALTATRSGEIAELSSSIRRLSGRGGPENPAAPAELGVLDKRLREATAARSENEMFATVVTGAQDSSPIVLRVHRGLPSAFSRKHDAEDLCRRARPDQAWRIVRPLYLGTFDEAFEVAPAGSNPSDLDRTVAPLPRTVVDLRTSSLNTVGELAAKNAAGARAQSQETTAEQSGRRQQNVRRWAPYKARAKAIKGGADPRPDAAGAVRREQIPKTGFAKTVNDQDQPVATYRVHVDLKAGQASPTPAVEVGGAEATPGAADSQQGKANDGGTKGDSYAVYGVISDWAPGTDADGDGYYETYGFKIGINADASPGPTSVYGKMICTTTGQEWWSVDPWTVEGTTTDYVYFGFDQTDFAGMVAGNTNLDFTVEIWNETQAGLLAGAASVTGGPVKADGVSLMNAIPGAFDVPSSIPTYLNNDTMYPVPGGEGGICWATAIADIFGYWDRNPYEGITYWNLVDNGVAPLLQNTLPSAPGHDQADVWDLVMDLGSRYYGPAPEAEDAIIEAVANTERGLNFNATYFDAVTGLSEKETYFTTIALEIDAGRPAAVGSWGTFFGSPHEIPVIGYMNEAGGDKFYIHRNTGGIQSEYVNLYDAAWGAMDFNTIVPGGTPSDQYENLGSVDDDQLSHAKSIFPADTYEFRQTHNFAAGSLGDGNDTEDWVKFTVSSGRRYTIQTANLGERCDTTLLLDDGVLNMSDNDSGPEPGASRIVYDAAGNGTVYIRINENLGRVGHDTNYDVMVTSVVLPGPSVTTGAASGITPVGATLNGTVNPNGSATSAYFQWGLTTIYGNTTSPQSMGSGTLPVAAAAGVGPLTCNTTYHVRLVGTGVSTVYGLDVPFTTSPCASVGSDFTGDRKSDVLWRHASGGDVWLWPMNGDARTAETYVRTVADTNWEIRGQGDQDGDGDPDLLWRNKVTGEVYFWSMSGTTPDAELYVGTVDPAYDIVGTGDFDGDGKSDIVWRHTTLGDVWIWLMDGADSTAEVFIDRVDPVYVVQGVGDLDADTKADIVWHHATTGEVWVWPMNGTTRLDQVWVGSVPDTGYQIQAVVDFTGDERADLVWWHATRGEVWIWTMNGTTRQAETWVGTVPDTGYQIVGTGDYNGDTKADLLWHHATRGEVWVWLMDGTARLSETWVATVPDVGYHIVR